MSATAPAVTRLYSVLLTAGDGRPGTWLTVSADDVIDAMRQAREHPWWGEDTPEWASSARVSAVECLGLGWH